MSPAARKDGWAPWVLRRRWIGAVAMLAMTGLAVWGLVGDHELLRAVRFEDEPDWDAYRDVARRFPVERGECFLVIEADDVFAPASVAATRRVIAAVLEVEGARDVVDLDDVVAFTDDGADPLLPEDGSTPDAFEVARARALSHPLVVGWLAAEDGRTLCLPVQQSGARDSRDVARDVRVRAQEAARGSPISVRTTGTAALFGDQRDVFQREFWVFQGAGYLLAAGIAALLFRGIASVVVTAIAPILGVFWAVGLLGLLGEELSALTKTVLPVLLMMIGFTDAIHLMIHVRRERRSGAEPLDAAASALRHLSVPCALTSLTTAVGFGSLLLSRSYWVKGFGFSCAVGVVCVFVAVITTVPIACSTRLGGRMVARPPGDGAWLRKRAELLIDGVLGHARPIAVLGVVATAVLVGSALRLRADDRISQVMPSRSEAYHALVRVDEAFGGIQFVYVRVAWDEGRDVHGALAVIADVEALVAGTPELSHPLSLRSLLAALPGPPGELAPRLPALALAPDALVSRFVDLEARSSVVVARMRDRGIAVHEPMLEELEEELAGLAGEREGFDFTLTGLPVARGREFSRVLYELAASLGLAAGIIFVVLTLAFRSARLGLVSVVPNLLPLAVTAALLVALGRPLELSSLCAFVVCLGIAVDDSIHFIARYRRERASGHGSHEALRRAFLGVGKALVFTTVVMVAGFAVVLTSELPMTRTFAAMSCSTIVAALVADLVLLPALLGFRDR